MLQISSLEYKKEFNIYHYNLLATVSLPDFRAQTAHVVDYFSRTIKDVIKHYMFIDTSLFYEYVSSDVTEYSEKLIKNTKNMYNLIKLFSYKSNLAIDPIIFDEIEAYQLLRNKIYLNHVYAKISHEEKYSTEIIQYINLTKVLGLLINQFPSSVVWFPFNYLKELFFSYNSIRLMNSITNQSIHPKLMQFNGLLFYIFKPFIPKDELMKIKEEINLLEIEMKRGKSEIIDELRSLDISLLEESLINLLVTNSNRISDEPERKIETNQEESSESSNSFHAISLNDTEMELIFIFLKRMINYKFKLNNGNVIKLILPYKNTILNLMLTVESKFLSREIFNCVILLLKNKVKLFPKLRMECIECRNKNTFFYEGEKFYKDALMVQIFKEAYFSDLLDEIDYSTCGCEVFNFVETLNEEFLWVQKQSDSIKLSALNAKSINSFQDLSFNYADMTNEDIYKECKMSKGLLCLVKYFFYISVHTSATVIHCNTTYVILNVMKSGKLWFVYELLDYILKYLYDVLFKCWCDNLDGNFNAFEPFGVVIYRNINLLVKHWHKSNQSDKSNNSSDVIFYRHILSLFKDWYNDDWVTLRLGYLNRLISKEKLVYVNRNKIDLWLENAISEPFLRYLSYFICEDIPEHESLG